MGLLDWLSPIVNGTAQTVSAFGAADDARAKAKQNAVVQQIQMLRQQKEDALKQSLGQSTIAKNNAEIGDIGSQQGLRAVQTKKTQYEVDHPTLDPNSQDVLSRKQLLAIDENRQKIKDDTRFGVHPAPTPYEPTPITDPSNPNATPQVGVFDKRTGKITTSGFGKPVAAGKGGASGMGSAIDRRAKSYVDLMVHSYPQLQNLASQVRPLMITTAVKHPLANYALNQAEQTYLQAARDFLAGVLHQESGARLTDSQILFGMQRYFPLAGDSPQTVQDKLHAAQTVMEERKAEYGNVAPAGGGGATQAPSAQSSGDPVLDEFGIGLVKKK